MSNTESLTINVKPLTCNNCGWSWYPRSPKRPAVCPSCKCRDWDNNEKRTAPSTVNIKMSADPKLRRALKEAMDNGVMYNGKPVSEELAFEVGAKYLLELCKD